MLSRFKKNKQAPVHPGEILKEEFLKPLKITKYRLAKELGIPAQRVGDIVNGKRAVSADTAMRLAQYFNTTAHFWLMLQMEYDLDHAQDLWSKKIQKAVKPCRLLSETDLS